MNPVKVRNITIGEGTPKICVPIVGVTKEEILEAGKNICTIGADVIEWRVDWYENVFDFDQVEETAKELRNVIGETALLFTFRTAKEGGEKAIETDVYVALNERAAKSGQVDLVDVEAFTGETAVKQIIETAHATGVKVVGGRYSEDCSDAAE